MKKSLIIFLAVGAWDYSSAQDTVKSNQPDRTVGSQTELSASHFLNKAMKVSSMEIEAGQLARQKALSADVKAYGSRMVKDHTESSNQLKALASRKNISLSMAQEAQAASPVTQSAGVSTGATGTATAATSGRDKSATTEGATNDAKTGAAVTSTTNTASAGNANVNANATGQYAAHADTGKHASHQEKLNKLRQSTGASFDREYMTMMVMGHTKAISLFEKGAELDDADIKAFAAQTLPILKDHLASAQTILSTLASANK